MNPIQQQSLEQTRRQFLGTSSRIGVGAAALATLLSGSANAETLSQSRRRSLATDNGPGYGPGPSYGPGPGYGPGYGPRGGNPSRGYGEPPSDGRYGAPQGGQPQRQEDENPRRDYANPGAW